MGKSPVISLITYPLFRCLMAFTCLITGSGCAQSGESNQEQHSVQVPIVQTGAEVLLRDKLHLLEKKKIAVVTNHTGRVGNTHLVDTLISLGISVQKIFVPEHGFRGEAEAGAGIKDGRDARTGLPIISLYGNKKMPTVEDLAGIDIVVYDIQDVGARFYTYLSTLVYCMDACARDKISLWVLDRPNPNGWYIGGPVLETQNVSFVGLHPVPVVHGMTLGEYALLVNGEGWLKEGRKCRLEIIKAKGYKHSMHWEDTGLEWIAPSPNLPTALSAEYYPILCWYEGTPVSVGRGTEFPFEQVGSPWHIAFKRRIHTDSLEGASKFQVYGLPFQAVSFVPRSIPGKSAQPMYEGEKCFGIKALQAPASGDSLWMAGLQLLQSFHQEYREQTKKDDFFRPFFRKLCGTESLESQVKSGKTVWEIQESWKAGIISFRAKRQKYLIYPEK